MSVIEGIGVKDVPSDSSMPSNGTVLKIELDARYSGSSRRSGSSGSMVSESVSTFVEGSSCH